MFVDIDNPKAPLGVEVMLFPYKKGKGKITPEVCFNVLKSTNYQRSIKDMLSCIMMLPKDEQEAFRDVVVSTFVNREQPNEVIVLGKKLAKSGGYEDELSSILRTVCNGSWLSSHAMAEKWQASLNYTLINEKGNVYFVDENVNLFEKDLVNINKLRFREGSDVSLWLAKNLPEDLDVSMCACVCLRGCNLARVKELKFHEKAEVDLSNTRNVPENLDVSMCSFVDLMGADLAKVSELKFRRGANVHLFACEYQPVHLDVSKCTSVDFNGSESKMFRHITFRDRRQMENCQMKFSQDFEKMIDFVEQDCDEPQLNKSSGNLGNLGSLLPAGFEQGR